MNDCPHIYKCIYILSYRHTTHVVEGVTGGFFQTGSSVLVLAVVQFLPVYSEGGRGGEPHNMNEVIYFPPTTTTTPTPQTLGRWGKGKICEIFRTKLGSRQSPVESM